MQPQLELLCMINKPKQQGNCALRLVFPLSLLQNRKNRPKKQHLIRLIKIDVMKGSFFCTPSQSETPEQFNTNPNEKRLQMFGLVYWWSCCFLRKLDDCRGGREWASRFTAVRRMSMCYVHIQTKGSVACHAVCWVLSGQHTWRSRSEAGLIRCWNRTPSARFCCSRSKTRVRSFRHSSLRSWVNSNTGSVR